MSRQGLQTAHSNLPNKLRLSLFDCELIVWLETNSVKLYDAWPDVYRATRVLNRLQKRGYIDRKYFPLRYALSRSGFSLARWISAASFDHDTATTTTTTTETAP